MAKLHEYEEAASRLIKSSLTEEQKHDLFTIMSFANTEISSSNKSLEKANASTEKAIAHFWQEKLKNMPCVSSIN